MKNKDAELFYRKYDILARPTSMVRYQRPEFDYRLFSDNDPVCYQVRTEQVQAVQLTISEEELKRLIESDTEVEDIRRRWGPNAINYMDEAHRILSQDASDKRVRRDNPAVNAAWEKYQMLLKIAGG